MSWFRKKESEIPLPPSRLPSSQNVLRKEQPGSGGPPSYRSNASTYNRSRDGPDPYGSASNVSVNGSGGPPSYQNNSQPAFSPGQDRYARNQGIGDPYARQGNADADRAELFSGYNPEKNQGQNRFADRYGGNSGGSGRWQEREPQNAEEEEEDVEQIKADTRALKGETLASTRNALRLAREAEETGRATLLKLGDQSEKIANTERHLDTSKANTTRAEDRTDEIRKLNRSIFIPATTIFGKEGKVRKEEARLAERYASEREEREQAMRDVRESQNRIGRAQTFGAEGDNGYPGQKPPRSEAQRAGRGRFQFEKTESDDELEDELDGNLDEIHDVTKRLRALAAAQGDELDNQNKRLARLNDNATKLDSQLGRATDRLKRIH